MRLRSGQGGIGKTALASKVLQDLKAAVGLSNENQLPLEGIVYFDTGTKGVALSDFTLPCANLLGVAEQRMLTATWANPDISLSGKIASLLSALGSGLYVFLLDNLEEVLNEDGHFTDQDLELFFNECLNDRY